MRKFCMNGETFWILKRDLDDFFEDNVQLSKDYVMLGLKLDSRDSDRRSAYFALYETNRLF